MRVDHHVSGELVALASALLILAITQNQIRRRRQTGQLISRGVRLAWILAVASVVVVLAGIALDFWYRP